MNPVISIQRYYPIKENGSYIVRINIKNIFTGKSLTLSCSLVVICLVLLAVLIRAILNIKESLEIRDWRVVTWNIIISVIGVAGCIYCIFF